MTRVSFDVVLRVVLASSADMNTHVFGAEMLTQLVVRSCGGHRDAVVGSYFLKDSLDVSLR